MRAKSKAGRLALVAGTVAAMALGLLSSSGTATADTGNVKLMNVNLASVSGPSRGVGQGILYGISADASQPADQYLKPLQLNAFRGGGWYAGGWVKDGYTYGPAMKQEIATIIAQGQRLQKLGGKTFQYQVILSDLFGSTGGLPASTTWPCTGGDCSNWTTMIDDVVTALQGSGVNFAFDIWNEPDLSIFWAPGVNTTQYFQMWDSAYNELRKIAPKSTIVGPSFAYTPQRMPNEWQAWIQHVKNNKTVPDMISNHDEGDVDDPVAVSQAITADLVAAGLKPLPLSANEYQPADRQTAGVTAWYLDRFAQSNYTNAMRGNWQCCMVPNLTGLLTHVASGWAPSGNWWTMRYYADMTGSLVATSQQVTNTAITAAKDPVKKQVVALVGDSTGYTGGASVTFNNLASANYVVKGGKVHATVYRIPDQGALYSPPVVFNQDVPVSGGSVTVPFNFQNTHDAFAIYLSQTTPQTVDLQAPDALTPGTYHIPVTFTNGSDVADTNVKIALTVSSDDPADASQIKVTCDAGKTATCPAVVKLPAGETLTANFTVTVPASVPKVAYRLTGTATAQLPDGSKITATNSADVISPCGVGDVCEAENGAMAGGACLATDHTGYTGSGFVACLTTPGAGVTQQFGVTTAGSYTLDLRYAAGLPGGPNQTRSATISVNGTAAGQISLPLTGSWNTWADATAPVQLTAGTNNITVSYQSTDLGWFNLDNLKLSS